MISTDRKARARRCAARGLALGLALGLVLCGLACPVAPAAAREPLSASDWLSGSVQSPDTISSWRPGDPRPREIDRRTRRDIAPTGAVEPVGVTRLGEGNPDGKGTVSPRMAGLPADLWGTSDSTTLAAAIRGFSPRLPALRRLERRILAAQLDAPHAPPGREGELFLARVDKLLDMGATGAARELLRAAGPGDPERFRRLFDIALLSGDEAAACQIMDRTPGVAPSFPARIFCLALEGDWTAAALVLHGAEVMGRIQPGMAALLAQFLDDGYVDLGTELPPPEVVTPLDLRLHAAIGQPLSSSGLPLAFALADLGQNGGWKARLEAAERLARAGAIPASQLRGIYLEQRPAASGGVWDRAGAVQALDRALAARDPAAVAQALPRAFDAMAGAGLGPALADMMGAELGALPLSGQAGRIALWLALAAGQSQVVHAPPADARPLDLWLLDFASGLAAAVPPEGPGSERAATLGAAFGGGAKIPEDAQRLIAADRRGEALLAAMADTDAGLDGDLARAARGLGVLRVLGQAESARQAAVELILAPVLMPEWAGGPGSEAVAPKDAPSPAAGQGGPSPAAPLRDAAPAAEGPAAQGAGPERTGGAGAAAQAAGDGPGGRAPATAAEAGPGTGVPEGMAGSAQGIGPAHGRAVEAARPAGAAAPAREGRDAPPGGADPAPAPPPAAGRPGPSAAGTGP